MTARTARGKLRSGATIIEALAAAVIIAVGIMGVMSLWGLSMNVTQRNDQRAVAYQVLRRTLERVKSQGFLNASEGTTLLYYDAAGGGESGAWSNKVYSATTVVTSSAVQVQNGVTTPADDAIRTVVTTVRRLSDNTVLETGGTYLVRGGL